MVKDKKPRLLEIISNTLPQKEVPNYIAYREKIAKDFEGESREYIIDAAAYWAWIWPKIALRGSETKAELDAINKAIMRRDFTLANGRIKGANKRKSKAGENREVIKQAIVDLFKNAKGWQMTYEEIANFLIDRKISPYTYSTTLKKVKDLTPAIKQKDKSGQ